MELLVLVIVIFRDFLCDRSTCCGRALGIVVVVPPLSLHFFVAVGVLVPDVGVVLPFLLAVHWHYRGLLCVVFGF